MLATALWKQASRNNQNGNKRRRVGGENMPATQSCCATVAGQQAQTASSYQIMGKQSFVNSREYQFNASADSIPNHN